VRKKAEKIKDHRKQKINISLPDTLMSAFAMFSSKEPSLLAFDEKRNEENMKNIYNIKDVPSDTHMRTLLDEVESKEIYPIFNKLFSELQR